MLMNFAMPALLLCWSEHADAMLELYGFFFPLVFLSILELITSANYMPLLYVSTFKMYADIYFSTLLPQVDFN